LIPAADLAPHDIAFLLAEVVRLTASNENHAAVSAEWRTKYQALADKERESAGRVLELEAQLSAPQTVEVVGQPASRDYAEGDTITVLLPAPDLKTWRVPSAFLTGERAQLPPACPHKRTASNAFGRICADCEKVL